MKRKSIGILLLTVCALSTSHRSRAEDLLGLYVGAAIGESHVRTSQEIVGDTGYDYNFDELHSGAWKVMAGIRPIRPLGVELSYIDFGNTHTGGANEFGFGDLAQADAKAWTLSALGFVPLAVPFLDVYGKLGFARLHTTSTELGPVPFCPAQDIDPGACTRSTFGISNSTTNAAYGVGVRYEIRVLAIRAEYERIAASGGNPDLFSVGVTWTF